MEVESYEKRVLITIALTIVLLSINSYIWVSEKTNKLELLKLR